MQPSYEIKTMQMFKHRTRWSHTKEVYEVRTWWRSGIRPFKWPSYHYNMG